MFYVLMTHHPVVCFDESNKQLLGEKIEPLPMEPGEPQRYDYQYERNGVCNLFMFFEPLTAWRHVSVTHRRTAVDYAMQMKYLVDECYPDALKIRIVHDQLNTHVSVCTKHLPQLRPNASWINWSFIILPNMAVG